MSQENVEIVRRNFEVINQGGAEAAISGGFWSPDCVWDPSPSGIPGLGVYRGYDEIRSALEDDWFGAFPREEWDRGRGLDRPWGSGGRHNSPAGSGSE